MAMAIIWKGTLTFGLVTIPVELKSAVRAEHISFRLLHKSDLSPVKYERFSSKGDGPLAWDEIVKGYEYSSGHYVVVTDDDFKHAALESSASIDILDFVPSSEIDPRYFETPYYLVPTKGGEKPYALLREVIRKTAVVGIGKIVMRQTQHLVGIKVVGEALVLEIMRFANELVDTEDLHFPGDAGVRPQELHMAEQLVKNLAANFDPSKYTDEYRANLMKIIQAKMRGKKIPAAKASSRATSDAKVIDLMARLKASLRDTGAAKKTSRTGKHVTRTAKHARARKSA
jgi:DNA end-binding protein Ku